MRAVGVAANVVLAIVTLVAFVTLHELIHVATGRLVGIPAHLLAPTSAGVSPQVAATIEPWRLAVMSGVAPVVTALLGFAAWALAVGGRVTRGLPRMVLTWVAFFGVPYIAIELALAGSRVVVNGSGSDFAAVAGIARVPDALRAVAVLVGLAWSAASARLVVELLRPDQSQPVRPLRLRDVRTTARLWRRLVGAVLVVAAIGLGLTGVAGVALGNVENQLPFYALIVWAVAVAFLVPWRQPGPRRAWRDRVLAAVVTFAVLFVYGAAAGNDYANLGIVTLPPLMAACLLTTADSRFTTAEM